MEPYFIGISGGSASGKSELLNKLSARYSHDQVCIISQDDYYKDIQFQKKDLKGIYNFDLVEAIDDQAFLKDLLKIKKLETVEKIEYTFNNPGKKPRLKVFIPAPVIIVEGLFIFYYPEICSLFDLKLFVHAKSSVRQKRRLRRDTEERSIPLEINKHQWKNHVVPAYKNYISPVKKKADIIINNNRSLEPFLEIIHNHIEKILSTQ